MNNIPTLSQDFYQHLAKQATLEFSNYSHDDSEHNI